MKRKNKKIITQTKKRKEEKKQKEINLIPRDRFVDFLHTSITNKNICEEHCVVKPFYEFYFSNTTAKRTRIILNFVERQVLEEFCIAILANAKSNCEIVENEARLRLRTERTLVSVFDDHKRPIGNEVYKLCLDEKLR